MYNIDKLFYIRHERNIMFSRFIATVFDIYTFPIRLWNGGCSDGSVPRNVHKWFGPTCKDGLYSEPDRFLAVFVGIGFYGFTALVLALILSVGVDRARWVIETIRWRRNRQHCQHCEKWTLHIGDGSEPGCISGQACCPSCAERHIDASIERAAEQETRMVCPHCSHEMSKEIEHRIILDVCGDCGGVFLSPAELQRLEKIATRKGYDNGYGQGRASGSNSGMAMGIIIGSAIN